MEKSTARTRKKTRVENRKRLSKLVEDYFERKRRKAEEEELRRSGEWYTDDFQDRLAKQRKEKEKAERKERKQHRTGVVVVDGNGVAGRPTEKTDQKTAGEFETLREVVLEDVSEDRSNGWWEKLKERFKAIIEKLKRFKE